MDMMDVDKRADDELDVGGLEDGSERHPKRRLRDVGAPNAKSIEEELAAQLELLKLEYEAKLSASEARCRAAEKRTEELDPSELAHVPREKLAGWCEAAWGRGFFGPSAHLPPPPEELMVEFKELFEELVVFMRDNGQTACVRPRPDLVSFACKLLQRLMKEGVITHCDQNPLRCLLEWTWCVAIAEDWQPRDAPGMVTKEDAKLISPTAGVSDGEPYNWLGSYSAGPVVEGDEPRMSCTGMQALLQVAEGSGRRDLAACLFDVVLGYLVPGACEETGTFDDETGLHVKAPDCVELLDKHVGPLAAHVLFETEYKVVFLKSALTRDWAIRWGKKEGCYALALLDFAWERMGGVSVAEACDNEQLSAELVYLPRRPARKETKVLPALSARKAKLMIWIFQKQGSMDASCGKTAGALRCHTQTQLVRGLVGLLKRRYTPASPLAWQVLPRGPVQIRGSFGILFLRSSDVVGAKWRAINELTLRGESLPAALQAWMVRTAAGKFKEIKALRDAGEPLSPELEAFEGNHTTIAKWRKIKELEAAGQKLPADLAAIKARTGHNVAVGKKFNLDKLAAGLKPRSPAVAAALTKALGKPVTVETLIPLFPVYQDPPNNTTLGGFKTNYSSYLSARQGQLMGFSKAAVNHALFGSKKVRDNFIMDDDD